VGPPPPVVAASDRINNADQHDGHYLGNSVPYALFNVSEVRVNISSLLSFAIRLTSPVSGAGN
jgi:hypothetical protein